MSIEGPSLQPEELTPYERVIGGAVKARRLISAHWELTYRCNERCSHCYLDVFSPNANVPDELTTEECFRVVDQLAELNILNITFSGGEILARRDFFTIAEYARSKRFLLRLFTNGILIKPAIADRIAALHPFAVELSVYSTRPEIHDAITRIPRSHELTLRAARLLKERDVRIQFKTPLMRENATELPALRALAKELDAQFRYDVIITPKDTGELDPLKHRMSHAAMVALFRDEIEPEQWLTRNITDATRTCGIASKGIAIDPYGNVYPCIQVRIAAGNVRRQTLGEIWETAPLWNDLSQLTMGELPVCRTCELRTMCVRCHGLARLESGDLRAPSLVNCQAALARREVLIEKGALPSDYPIPAHLRDYAEYLRAESTNGGEPLPTNFIPLAELAPMRARIPA
jgi:radical SAM protein with 4Fe4S-binding SPASM domain